ncbi:MAG: 16S rRNA (cytidine(1402)-2'-O)-methyltransferase [Chloroflexota bacterium]
MGTLYLVATPIGNLEDISARALRLLQDVGLIAAEDTRVTRKLLSRYNIHTCVTSYYEHNKLTKLGVILNALAQGDVALVSDAGTPALNDPGYELVRAVLEAGHTVSSVPGPCAPIAALTASGLSSDAFLYLGYLPRKSSERRALLERVSNLPYTLIFFETPHRLNKSLADLETMFGDRQIAVARELTKVYEQIWRGTITEAREYFAQNEPRGEFTLVVAGKTTRESGRWMEEKLLVAIREGLKAGEAPSPLAARLARESGWERGEVYDLLVEMRPSKSGKG